MPRVKEGRKVLSSGRLSPSGLGGDLRIIIDKTLIISRVIDSSVMLIYNFVDKSPDLFYNPDTAHSSAWRGGKCWKNYCLDILGYHRKKKVEKVLKRTTKITKGLERKLRENI